MSRCVFDTNGKLEEKLNIYIYVIFEIFIEVTVIVKYMIRASENVSQKLII